MATKLELARDNAHLREMLSQARNDASTYQRYLAQARIDLLDLTGQLQNAKAANSVLRDRVAELTVFS